MTQYHEDENQAYSSSYVKQPSPQQELERIKDCTCIMAMASESQNMLTVLYKTQASSVGTVLKDDNKCIMLKNKRDTVYVPSPEEIAMKKQIRNCLLKN